MSKTTSLKEELDALKIRLETIEEQLTSQSKEIEKREQKWKNIEPKLGYIINTQGERIKLNIGGKIFSTSAHTLSSIRDSLLARLIDSGKIDTKEEIFIDRSHRVFEYILDFYRIRQINYKKLSKDDLKLLKEDAEYYHISEISNYLEERLKEPSFIKFESNANYIYSGKTAGTNKIEDLSSTDLKTGICANSPGKIIIEMNADYEFEEIEIAGWNGDSTIWYNENGAGAKIMTSMDKIKWKDVGKISSGYGKAIKKIKVTKSTGKYIKFEHTSYLGLGYLRIIKCEDF